MTTGVADAELCVQRWVDEKFEAIIAAEWPVPVVDPPGLLLHVDPAPGRPRHDLRPPSAVHTWAWWTVGALGLDGWVRERSPPATR